MSFSNFGYVHKITIQASKNGLLTDKDSILNILVEVNRTFFSDTSKEEEY